MFEDEHLLEGTRCGRAESRSLLTAFVASLVIRSSLALPYQHPCFSIPPLRDSSPGLPHSGDESAIRTTLRRLAASTDLCQQKSRHNTTLEASTDFIRNRDKPSYNNNSNPLDSFSITHTHFRTPHF